MEELGIFPSPPDIFSKAIFPKAIFPKAIFPNVTSSGGGVGFAISRFRGTPEKRHETCQNVYFLSLKLMEDRSLAKLEGDIILY